MVWNHNIEGAATLKTINLISTVFSLSGTLWASYYCLKIPNALNNSLKFIFSITFADFIFSCGNLMSHFEQEEGITFLCYAEAFIRQCSFFLSLFFATSLSLLCYKTAKHGGSFDQASFFKKVLIVGFIACLIMTSLPFFTDKIQYINGELYCGISANPGAGRRVKLLVKFFYIGVPIMTCLLVTLFSYIKMVREIKSLQTGPVTALSISPYKLFLYPILLFVVYFPCFLYSFTILSLGKNEHVFVRGLHLFATHSVGFPNAVLYGTQMKSYYRKLNEPEEDLMFSSFLSDENSDPES